VALVFVNRYFYPDHAATGQLLADLAFHAAREGHAVSVITARQRLDHPAARLPGLERIRGVQVHRVWTTCFGRQRLAGRALDYLSFHVSATLALVRRLRAGDTLVAATDPPLLGVSAAFAARFRRARLVQWLHDLFPETAQALGMRVAGGWVGGWLARSRDRSLADAAANVALGRAMRDYLVGRGVAPQRIRVIHNWSDGEAVRPLAHRDNPLRAQWGLDRRFVVAYSGNLGRAHDLGALPRAAARLCDLDDLVFLFLGAGAGVASLREELARCGVDGTRLVFMGYQPRGRLRFSLGAADVHLTSLRPELEGFIVPSKLYGVMAAGRPCVHLGAATGEAGQILAANGCGLVVEPGDVPALERAIRRLHADAALRRRMGDRARRAFEERFERRQALAQWMDVLAPGAPVGAS
jgi:glycosyltransferase involved in cell wall biosynthesis